MLLLALGAVAALLPAGVRKPVLLPWAVFGGVAGWGLWRAGLGRVRLVALVGFLSLPPLAYAAVGTWEVQRALAAEGDRERQLAERLLEQMRPAEVAEAAEDHSLVQWAGFRLRAWPVPQVPRSLPLLFFVVVESLVPVAATAAVLVKSRRPRTPAAAPSDSSPSAPAAS